MARLYNTALPFSKIHHIQTGCSPHRGTRGRGCARRGRGTGAGFCYNAGRLIAAAGPFLVGSIAARGAGALGSALQVLFYVGFVPLIGLLVMPWVMETKDRALAD